MKWYASLKDLHISYWNRKFISRKKSESFFLFLLDATYFAEGYIVWFHTVAEISKIKLLIINFTCMIKEMEFYKPIDSEN